MKLHNINASYKDKKIYENVSVDFNHVGMTFVKGDSGCGKTTLLNILYGLKSFEGDYVVDGEVDDFIRNNISYIFQDFKVDRNLTVYENIILQLDIKGIDYKKNDIEELLHRFGMFNNRNKLAKVLSGGEKQRLAIIRVLVTKPTILLCDEPTGNLDEDTSFEIFDLLKEISKDKLVIVVSHSQYLIEKYADVVYEIIDKKLVETKSFDSAELVYSQNDYEHISYRNLAKLIKKNFKNNFVKYISVFLVFSIFSSLYVLLNFSNNYAESYLNDKYDSYPSRDLVYVTFKRGVTYKQIEEIKNEVGFDAYLGGTYIQDLTETARWDMKNLYSTTNEIYLDVYPFFANEVEIDKYWPYAIDKYIENPYNFKGFTDEHNLYMNMIRFNSDIRYISDFSVLGEYLSVGRLPENEYELLINNEMLKNLVNKYNDYIVSSELGYELLDFESLTSEDKLEFINQNNPKSKLCTTRYEFQFLDDRECKYEFIVVGVIENTNLAHDYSARNAIIPPSWSNEGNVFRDSFVYAPINYNDKFTKWYTKGFRITTNTDRNNLNFDPKSLSDEEIFGDHESIEDKSIINYAEFYKKDLDYAKLEDKIKKLEGLISVDKVVNTNLIKQYYIDLEKIAIVNKQIMLFSIYILLIAFITAFVPFYFFISNRKDEFSMYKILGMNDKTRFKVYLFEVIGIIITVTVLIGLSYFVLTNVLGDRVNEIFKLLVYSHKYDQLNMIFSFKEIIVLLTMFIPFISLYTILQPNRGGN